jgi:hypothetical protein
MTDQRITHPEWTRTIRLEVGGRHNHVLFISRQWIGNRWEVVVSDAEGAERSRRGYDTMREAIDAMAERARQWVSEQA